MQSRWAGRSSIAGNQSQITSQPRPGVPAIYSVTISASDVGSRVMVRTAIPGGFTDVVGDLVEWTAGSLTIVTRRGPVAVALDSVVAGKCVPPAVARKVRPRPADE